MILSSAPGNRIGVVFVHHAGQSVFSTSVRRLFCLVLLYSMRQALSRGISDFLLDFGFSRGNYRVWPGASMSQGGLRSGVSRLIRAARGLPSSGRDFLRRGFPPPGTSFAGKGTAVFAEKGLSAGSAAGRWVYSGKIQKTRQQIYKLLVKI